MRQIHKETPVQLATSNAMRRLLTSQSIFTDTGIQNQSSFNTSRATDTTSSEAANNNTENPTVRNRTL